MASMAASNSAPGTRLRTFGRLPSFVMTCMRGPAFSVTGRTSARTKPVWGDPRRRPAATARMRAGVEQQVTHFGEDGVQGLGHALHSAPPNSLISTRRRAGLGCA